MIEDILKKESLDENDLKVLHNNLHLLSDDDLKRLGFKTEEEAEVVAEVSKEEDPVEEPPKRRRKA